LTYQEPPTNRFEALTENLFYLQYVWRTKSAKYVCFRNLYLEIVHNHSLSREGITQEAHAKPSSNACALKEKNNTFIRQNHFNNVLPSTSKYRAKGLNQASRGKLT